jgi:hypothetical protein
MLVHESRILQVTIFGVLRNNLNSLDFSLLLPDVMTIADGRCTADAIDEQLYETREPNRRLVAASAGSARAIVSAGAPSLYLVSILS